MPYIWTQKFGVDGVERYAEVIWGQRPKGNCPEMPKTTNELARNTLLFCFSAYNAGALVVQWKCEGIWSLTGTQYVQFYDNIVIFDKSVDAILKHSSVAETNV